MTDTNDGTAFQRDVGDILKAYGYDVESNRLLGHKKVDHVVSFKSFGKRRVIAVECKDHARRLTQRQVSEIYANYLPLTPKYVDEILIITRMGASETADRLVFESDNISMITLKELLDAVLDFNAYAKGLIDSFEADSVANYYVPLRSDCGPDLFAYLETWLGEPERSPIAILGSYGQGKTTYARFLAYTWSRAWKDDDAKRIPILIRLGEIGTEQSLEGLLGKVLTTSNHVGNYNFASFMELNKLGRFVILLDGFDEMKQALTSGEFRHNFKELNRLCVGAAKILLFGRPTAFVTEMEQRAILHGERQVGHSMIHDPDWPDYEEVRLAPFTNDDIQLFLDQYFSHLIHSSGDQRVEKRFNDFDNFSASRLWEGGLGELARRPIQLRMIAEVLPDFLNNLESLTKHTLYDYFIDYVIERDLDKHARLLFTPADRRRFARHVAVWLWSSRRDSSFNQDSVPKSLLENFNRPGLSIDAVERDLLAASLLDRIGPRLHFPHRSIQEFLVAQAVILNDPVFAEAGDIASLLEPDVVDFLDGFIRPSEAAVLRGRFLRYRGSLPLDFVRLLSRGVEDSAPKTQASPWELVLLAVSLNDGGYNRSQFETAVADSIRSTGSTRDILAYLYATYIYSRRDRKKIGALSKVWMQILSKLQEEVRRVKLEKEKVGGLEAGWKFLDGNLVKIFQIIQFSNKNAPDVRGVFKVLHSSLSGYVYVSNWDAGDYLDYADAKFEQRLWGLPNEFEADVAELLQDVKMLKRTKRGGQKGSHSRA